jgi:hypothetical protein
VSINDLDKLIEELLQEFKITIKDDGSYDPSLKTGLGVGLKAFKPQNKKGVEQFAALAPETDEIDIKDFNKAFFKNTDAKFKTVAQNVLKNTNKAEVFTAIKNLGKSKHGITASDLKTTPGYEAAQKAEKAEMGRLAREKEILNKAVGIYNATLQDAKDLGLNLTELDSQVLQSYSSDNYQQITSWITASKKAIKDEKEKQELKKQRKELAKSAKSVKQQFPRHEPGSVMDPSKAQELTSLKASDDLSKGALKFINLFLTTDYTKIPTYEEFKSSVKSLNSEIVVNATRKILDSEMQFTDQKREKLESLLKIAKIVDTSTFKDLADERTRNRVLYYAFKKAGANLPSVEGVSLEDPALDIKKLKTGNNLGQEIFSKTSLKDLDFTDALNSVITSTLSNQLKNAGINPDTGELNENLSTTELNIDLVADIFDSTNDADKKELSKKFKAAFTETYKVIATHSEFNDEERKKAQNYISNLIRATDYYASNRKVRTKRGATTGWKVGTAQASGTARVDKEVQDMMRKAGGGSSTSNIKQKLLEYSKFLDGVNRVLKNDDGKFDQDKSIQTLFSQFVGLEILNDTLFQSEEATVKGNLFESFLALICGGIQIGSDRGGADYYYFTGKKKINGSAKLINTTEFKQAKENLKEDMEYVIAIKYIKTKTGELKLAGENDKIRFVKIFIVYSGIKSPTTVPHIGKDLTNLTIKGKDTGTEVKFDMRSLMKSSYVCDLDFSFLEQAEFSDVSTKIMNKINSQLEQAFSSLTNLRDNITRWVSDKDIVAANQVDVNQKELGDAIQGMKDDDSIPDSNIKPKEELSESIQQLDELILEILQESLDK